MPAAADIHLTNKIFAYDYFFSFCNHRESNVLNLLCRVLLGVFSLFSLFSLFVLTLDNEIRSLDGLVD